MTLIHHTLTLYKINQIYKEILKQENITLSEAKTKPSAFATKHHQDKMKELQDISC